MGDEADADARGRLGTDRQLELLGTDADLLGDDERADDVGLGQQHDELVAAVAIGTVDRPDRAGDHGTQ